MNDSITIKIKAEEKKLTVCFDGSEFASYSYSEAFPKPFFTELYNKNGDSFTRFEEKAVEHPHQRSVFIGIGEVNGFDFWNEKYDSNIGYQRHIGFTDITVGGKGAEFTAKTLWQGKDGQSVLSDIRTFRFYRSGENCKVIELSLTLKAEFCDVAVGATKEAGPLGLRVCDSLRGDRGGLIENAEGLKTEKECWGKRAAYCVYGGDINGKHCEIKITDDPQNENFPTYWHVRDYGLFAPNNLYFIGGYTIEKGKEKTYKYKLEFSES